MENSPKERTVRADRLRFKCHRLIEILELKDASNPAKNISLAGENFYSEGAKKLGLIPEVVNGERRIRDQIASSYYTYKTITAAIAYIFHKNDTPFDIDNRVCRLLSVIEIPEQNKTNKDALEQVKTSIELTIKHCIRIVRERLGVRRSDAPKIILSVNDRTKSRWFIDFHVVEKLLLVESNHYPDEVSPNQNSISKLKGVKNPEIDFSFFNYVAALDRFNLLMPVSLIKKLSNEEYQHQRLHILKEENSIGIEYFYCDDTKTEFLCLNESGKKFAESKELDEILIINILDYCDIKQEAEKKLLSNITTKEFFFINFFKSVGEKYIDYLIHSNVFPSLYKKAPLYRLKALLFAELNDYENAHNNFKKCIDLIRKNNSEKSSSFYLSWAEMESDFGKENVAIDIYHQALIDLPLPNNKNHSSRFTLSIYYYQQNNYDQAIELWSDEEYVLVRDEEFINRFSKYFRILVKKDPKKATSLQDFILYLLKKMRVLGYKQLAANYLEQINQKITNNYKLKIALIRSLFSDKPKMALSLIKKLESDKSIKAIESILLKMDYQVFHKNIDLAIWIGEDIIQNYPEIEQIERLYKKLGFIYLYNKKNPHKAKEYFEFLNSDILKSYYPYAAALSKIQTIKFDPFIFNIYINYFLSNPLSSSSKAIGSFVTYCLRFRKWNEASKIIFEKIQQIHSNDKFNNFFISFIFQQQLKLTTNEEQAFLIFENALNYADTNKKQDAIVYSAYAKHLMYRNQDNKVSESTYDLFEALKYLRLSDKIRADDYNLLDQAKCHFLVGHFKQSLSLIRKIKSSKLFNEKVTLKMKILFHMREFDTIHRIIRSIEKSEIKGLGYYYLAQNKQQKNAKRLIFFDKAIELNSDNDIKLKYAVFCYEIKYIKKSKQILNRIKTKLKNEDDKLTIQTQFLKRISIFLPRANARHIRNIRTSIRKLRKTNPKVIKSIDNLLKKYPLDFRIHTLKFNYYYKFKIYQNCDRILQNLIEENLVNKKTIHLFSELSKKYFEYSQYENLNKTSDRFEQSKALTTAFRYMEYVLKIDSSFEDKLLYAIIPYKQGYIEKHKKIIKVIRKNLNSNEKVRFNKEIGILRSNINIFLWEARIDDYYDKLLFYRKQIRKAAIYIKSSLTRSKAFAIKLLNSIALDKSFHEANKFSLLDDINTRLGHYYYFYEKDFNTALIYKKEVYKSKSFDAPFIRAFLNTIDKNSNGSIKYYANALEICDFYLKTIQIPTIYRFQGNWFKETGKFKRAYEAYCMALKLCKEHFNLLLINNNILILCHTSLVKYNRPFDKADKLKDIANKSFQNILHIDLNYRYKDEALEMIKEIQNF